MSEVALYCVGSRTAEPPEEGDGREARPEQSFLHPTPERSARHSPIFQVCRNDLCSRPRQVRPDVVVTSTFQEGDGREARAEKPFLRQVQKDLSVYLEELKCGKEGGSSAERRGALQKGGHSKSPPPFC